MKDNFFKKFFVRKVAKNSSNVLFVIELFICLDFDTFLYVSFIMKTSGKKIILIRFLMTQMTNTAKHYKVFVPETFTTVD